jgi:hypothetical protein
MGVDTNSISQTRDLVYGPGGVLTMQAAGVLVKRALPRYRHCQHQRIERRVIEALANQSPRRIRRKPIELLDRLGTLLL